MLHCRGTGDRRGHANGSATTQHVGPLGWHLGWGRACSDVLGSRALTAFATGMAQGLQSLIQCSGAAPDLAAPPKEKGFSAPHRAEKHQTLANTTLSIQKPNAGTKRLQPLFAAGEGAAKPGGRGDPDASPAAGGCLQWGRLSQTWQRVSNCKDRQTKAGSRLHRSGGQTGEARTSGPTPPSARRRTSPGLLRQG